MKKIAILGITGSIGMSAVEVVRKHSDKFKITLATSHNNLVTLQKLKDELNIDRVISTGKVDKRKLSGVKELIRVLESEEFDIIINAVSGSAGLNFSYHVLKNKHPLALANKESLVMAGHILTKMSGGKSIIPIDSEHSALFQLMQGLNSKDVKSLILTASGGPFRTLALTDFQFIKPEDALAHPTWSMGAKITIDSATMFNKGLEVIEAHWLFGLDYSQIKAIIHPQSIIHSMIECNDGSILAQMSNPSMQLPILYALSYPHHFDSDCVSTDLLKLSALTFEELFIERYPLYFLALEVGKMGGIMPTVMNAANEAAINLFLQNKIKFNSIYDLIKKEVEEYQFISDPDIDTILEVNKTVFDKVTNAMK